MTNDKEQRAVDTGLIHMIARRVASYTNWNMDELDVIYDLTAAHFGDCPLRLAEFLAADRFNFAHDIFGIHAHLNRETGRIERFCPRFSKRRGD